jgi:hypothetical protein
MLCLQPVPEDGGAWELPLRAAATTVHTLDLDLSHTRPNGLACVLAALPRVVAGRRLRLRGDRLRGDTDSRRAEFAAGVCRLREVRDVLCLVRETEGGLRAAGRVLCCISAYLPHGDQPRNIVF